MGDIEVNDVFITGLGVVYPGGSGTVDYWDNMLSDGVDASIVFEDLKEHVANRYVFINEHKYADETIKGRSSLFCIDAVRQAVLDAGLNEDETQSSGLMIGTTMGDESLIDIDDTPVGDSERNDPFPFQISASVANEFGMYGPNLTVSNACTSGLYCIDLAAAAVQRGDADIVIAGGVESASLIVLGCFNRLGALDDGVCKPFDVSRKGTVLGEGAAFVVLESAESVARRKNAHIYCTYKGSGWSCDAYQTTAPEPGGKQICRALNEALENSQVSAEEIGCVLPHATGTPLNDALEMQVLNDVFGNSATPPTITAIKSRLGHSGGASGAFSVLTACLIMEKSLVPTTLNLNDPEADLSVPVSLTEPAEISPENVLINAYAFGGNNISMILGASQELS